MLRYGLKNSDALYYKDQRMEDDLPQTICGRKLLKNEHFAYQLILCSDQKTFYTLSPDYISYQGIHLQHYRIEAMPWQHVATKVFFQRPSLHFVGYVPDDHGRYTSDPILKKQGIERGAKCQQGLWIEDCFLEGQPPGVYETRLIIYSQEGYEKEEKVGEITLAVNLLAGTLCPLNQSDFFLDLWQHPSNWARTYEMAMWQEDHFKVIEHYLREMANLGQKVVTLIVSDYPWAGQRCFEEKENPGNLFEHKMAHITRSDSGDYAFDFSPLVKYVKVAKSVGIDQEYDIFGLLGNWDGYTFGRPIGDFEEPIRLKYRCQETGTYGFIKDQEVLKAYIKALFKVLNTLGILEKTRVICDEPDDFDRFNRIVSFLEAAAGVPIMTKAALHVPKVFEEGAYHMKDISLGLNLLGKAPEKALTLRDHLHEKNGTLTWYVCCFPQRPNHFIPSPRLESRLTGWMTYYFGLDGFLRWDFALWPETPFKKTRYKYPKWTAGDMFFVYPGKDLKPMSSQRFKNLTFGLQDYQILKKGMAALKPKEQALYMKKLEALLGNKDQINVQDLEVDMTYHLKLDNYLALKEDLAHYLQP